MAGFAGSRGGQTQLGKAIKPATPGRPPGAALGGLRAAPRPAGASLTGLTPTPNPKTQVPAATPPKASATSTVPPSSPLDSTYYENLAGEQLKVGNQINALNAEASNLQTNLQSALAQLAYQQPRDQLKLEQGANRTGALYSTAYAQNLGNLNNQYLTKQTGLQTAESQKVGSLAAQIAGLQQGQTLYNAGQYDAAVGRAVKAAAANPATGQASVTPAATPASVAAQTLVNGASAPKGTVKKNGTLNVNVPKVKSGFGYRGGI